MLTPKTIKSGFRATGIVPFDPDIFGESDYIEPVESPQASSSPSTPIGNQSILDEVGPLKCGTPKKPSNRGRKPMQSSVLTSPEVLTALKEKTAQREMKEVAKSAKPSQPPKQGTKRARGAPVNQLPAKPAAKCSKLALTKTFTQKTKPKEAEALDEDMDFCIICLKLLPRKLTIKNSIKCIGCDRPVHLKCANHHASFWQCQHCKNHDL